MPSISATHSTLGQNEVQGRFEFVDTSVYVQNWRSNISACNMSPQLEPLISMKLVTLFQSPR